MITNIFMLKIKISRIIWRTIGAKIQTFEFDVVVYNFYLDLQLNIQVSYFSTLLVDLTLFVSRLNFVVRSIQHSSLRNSTFNFRKYPTASQSIGTLRSDDGNFRFKITSCACAIVKAFKRECRRAPVHDLYKLAFTSSSQRKVTEVSI